MHGTPDETIDSRSWAALGRQRPAPVIWITGLSAAGKTSMGRTVVSALRQVVPNVLHLDGDDFRAVMGHDLDHDAAARRENAFRIARTCRYVAEQGVIVVCSTMSLYPEVWSWNREHVPGYFEVYLRVDPVWLARRDPKGLYARARRGLAANVVGVDLPFHEPPHPHLVIDNGGASLASLPERAHLVLESVCKEAACKGRA